MSDPAVIGFFGKLPSKGDFVQAGLPRGFVEAWDGWMQDRLSAARAQLGPAWLGLWMEAPIWRFALGAGQCGAAAMTGLWMPSVDRVGRHFPLTVAAPTLAPEWLDAAEPVALAAVEQDVSNHALAAALAAIPAAERGSHHLSGTNWWTQGAPAVAPCRREFAAMPSREEFVAMLTDDDQGRPVA